MAQRTSLVNYKSLYMYLTIDKLFVFIWIQAIVLGGTLNALFKDYKDRADFLCVYLAEAHPRGRWVFSDEFSFMDQHKTIQDRIDVAR